MTYVELSYGSDGVSVTLYADDGTVLDETWHTYDEIDDLKGDDHRITLGE